jgi:hypothetical protein
MAFKAKAFEKAKFEPRTVDVPVPGMAEWFEGDPVWKVRGLTGNELGRCNEMMESRKSLTEIIQDILVKKNDESADDYVPKEKALRVEYLILGSLDPVCDMTMAAKINEPFPAEFNIITTEIIRLTGQGQTVGKQTPSGKKAISEPA